MRRVLAIARHYVLKFLKERFNLYDDKADEAEIIDSIKRNVDFKGTNLWTLIFAIFIASIGLNVNSTAVVIGAMLVSPLMGPIMGVGLGIGINDFELVKRGLKNLLIAAAISIATSTFYFFITPLHEAQSELLARTTPTIWDVFIAFFGGLAGIVAGTRKEKSNVIPGVAIATALMPPLCTAGFGLAIGNMLYFVGALYLFFINSVFICISTYIIVRYLKLPKKEFEDQERKKKVTRYILIIVIITALPSIYLAYRIVNRSIFETNANTFIQHEFNFKNTQIVVKKFNYDHGNEIDLLLIGEELSKGAIDSLKAKLPQYNLKGAKLNIRQGLNAKHQIDLAQVKASILEDVFSKQKAQQAAEKAAEDTMKQKLAKLHLPIPDVKGELKSLYPDIKDYSIAQSVVHSMDTTTTDTITVFVARCTKYIDNKDRIKLTDWLKARMNSDSVKLLVEVMPKPKTHHHRRR